MLVMSIHLLVVILLLVVVHLDVLSRLLLPKSIANYRTNS